MRRSWFHEEALRATSRITGLGVGVLALSCARSGDPGASEPESPTGKNISASGAAVAEAEPSPGSTGSMPEPVPEPDPLAECRAVTRDAFDDRHQLRADADAVAVKSCCATIAADVDERLRTTPDPISAWPERNACCGLLEWRGSIACTPWGPTAPPPTRRERVAFADAAVLDLRASAREAAGRLGLLDPRALVIDGARVRDATIATWRARMVNETVSARVFEAVARQMSDAGFDAATVAECRGFASEEREHGVLCGAVVEALGGQAIAPTPPLPEVPVHPDASPRAAVLRNVLSISALSETVAVALIGAERLQMPASPLRTLLTRIWADEIGHANAGWRLLRRGLSSDDGALASDLRRYLPTAIDDLITHELAHLPVQFVAPPGGAAWGLCHGRDARQLFADTLERVILPGLDALLRRPAARLRTAGARELVGPAGLDDALRGRLRAEAS